MFEIKGAYNTAIVYSNSYDDKSCEQILELCNQESLKDSNIRIMPDYHAGKGCVIGTTIKIHDKVIPNLVGVDIGCLVSCWNLGKINVNLEQLDDFIRNNIPAGTNVRDKPFSSCYDIIIDILQCKSKLKDIDRIKRGIGTLGGGNHFIELSKDDEEDD